VLTAQEGDYSGAPPMDRYFADIDENVGAKRKAGHTFGHLWLDGITANLTRVLRTKIKNDSLTEICGNHLGGDPYVGHGKILLIN